MYPNRHPNPLPPPNAQHAKEVISELCDRIKSEYTTMYTHIQNLKTELDKAATVRADYERHYSLNCDMSATFTNEIHKMIDIIKRLVQACMLQVPYLPPDLQSSCVHLIEQVRHYTSNDQAGPFLHPQMTSHPPPPQQPPHITPNHSHLNPPPPPPQGGGQNMMPQLHSGSNLPSHYHMMQYMSRMHQQHGIPDSREIYNQPNDMYRLQYKDFHPPINSSEICNGSFLKEKQIAFCPKNGNSNTSQITQQNGHKQNGIEFIPTQSDSPKETQEVGDLNSEKGDDINKQEANEIGEEITEESSNESKANQTVCVQKNQNISSNQKKPENESSNKINNQNSPLRQNSSVMHPYDRRSPISISRHANMVPNHFYHMQAPRHQPNGGHQMFPHNYPPQNDNLHAYPMNPPPPLPPSFVRGPQLSHQSFDSMMMMRNSFPPPPYGGQISPYNVQSSLNSYPSNFNKDMNECLNGQNSGVPNGLTMISTLQQEDLVCYVSFSNPFNYAFTGSKGIVKIWDVNEISVPKLLGSIDCLNHSYVRSIKAINNNKLLVISGEFANVELWSLSDNSSNSSNGIVVNNISEFRNPASVTYAMSVTPDDKYCYCCCSNGNIVGWDIEAATIVRNLTGHVDGVTCIDISNDGNIIWTGGLDSTARCWDTREGKQIHTFTFPTQVFSLAIVPSLDYIVVGLENKTIELCHTREGIRFGERHVFKVHESCVLSLKVSANGKWLMSSGKDNYMNCVKIPQGIPLFLTRENSTILCTDLSPEDKYVICGSNDKRSTIYECAYA